MKKLDIKMPGPGLEFVSTSDDPNGNSVHFRHSHHMGHICIQVQNANDEVIFEMDEPIFHMRAMMETLGV